MIDHSKVKSIVRKEIENSMGELDGELSGDRATAMDYYLGEPFGNEVEGRSQVVTWDVHDVIEWVLASLLRIFASSDEVVCFDPQGPEDEELADQETDYVNHVFYKKNNGFLILYQWFKDALLQKNGYVKRYWTEDEETKREEYSGLDDESFSKLYYDEELELKEHTEYPAESMMPDPMTGEMIPTQITLHDAVFERTETKGREEIVNVPPEEFLISRESSSIYPKYARFTGQRVRKTRSELKQEGFKDSDIGLMQVGQGDNYQDEERIARRHLEDEDEWAEESSEEATEGVWIYELYMDLDYNEDGVAEYCKVTYSGDYVDVEEYDSCPFHALTPNILPHKHFGLSLADSTMPIQLIKSTLLRAGLDGLYQSTRPRVGADKDMVNLDDLLGDGNIIRTDGPPGESLMPFDIPNVFPQAMGGMEYMDQLKKDRTGVGDDVQGLDADTLARANTGVVNQSFDAANMRIEQIARIFAETGVKDLMLGIHADLIKHQDKEDVVKLRNKWVKINPSEWRDRTDMTVQVGLGTGNKDQQLLHLQSILGLQEKIVANGGMGTLVTAKNIYNAASKLVENAGLKEPELYFSDPPDMPPQPEKPDPAQQALEAQMQIEQQKVQLDAQKAQMESERKMMETMGKLEEMKNDMEIARGELMAKLTELELKYNQNVPGSSV